MAVFSDKVSAPSPGEVLDYSKVYTCPVCAHGQITGLTLMEAFACNFCHHIFTANLQQQILYTADSSQPLAWRRVGQRWRSLHQANSDVTILLWSLGTIVALFPPLLVGLAAYVFPPADAQFASFPVAWTALTFCLHFIPMMWLLVEYHQFPPYIRAKVWLGRLWRIVQP